MARDHIGLKYVPYAGDNTPPYLYHVANHCSDLPSALSFIRWMEIERVEYEREMWEEAHAAGVV